MDEKDKSPQRDNERSNAVIVRPDPQLMQKAVVSGGTSSLTISLRTELNRAWNEYQLGNDEDAIATVRKLINILDQSLSGISSVAGQEQGLPFFTCVRRL